jgi:hypothetical protein
MNLKDKTGKARDGAAVSSIIYAQLDGCGDPR